MPLSVYQNMVSLLVFPSGDIQVYLWILQCGNIIPFTLIPNCWFKNVFPLKNYHMVFREFTKHTFLHVINFSLLILLIIDDSLLYKKPCTQFIHISKEKCVFTCFSVPLPSHLTCTCIKSNLYLNNSLKTIIMETALYILHTFHVPNLMSIFRCLSKESVQTWGSLIRFITSLFFHGEGLLAPCPTPKLEATFCCLSGCLFIIFKAAFHSQRPSLHPQPEDTPICGDKGTT
jgi:hypothetical protein